MARGVAQGRNVWADGTSLTRSRVKVRWLHFHALERSAHLTSFTALWHVLTTKSHRSVPDTDVLPTHLHSPDHSFLLCISLYLAVTDPSGTVFRWGSILFSCVLVFGVMLHVFSWNSPTAL